MVEQEELWTTYRAKLLKERLADYEIEIEGESSVIDVLTDMRHLCDLQGWNLSELDRRARYRYEAEIREEGVAHG